MLVIKILRLTGAFLGFELFAFSFAIGFGVIGWILFPLGIIGILTPVWVTAVLILGCAGWKFAFGREKSDRETLDVIGFGLLAVIAAVMFFDFAEALSPPGDADTLAYHYTISRNFASLGRIEFIPQAFVGAVPLLTHMTYAAAFSLGGELTATLWSMISGWAVAWLLFVICRRYVSLNWSLAIAVIYLTVPAVIFGAGSGQIEPRLALYVLVAGWASAQAVKTKQLSYVALAGLAVGFYMGSKYFGAFLALSCGLIVISNRKWFVSGIVYSIVAIVAGFQWYLWNFLNTGDPVFPMLYKIVGNQALDWWQTEPGQISRDHFLRSERATPSNISWFFKYPIVATFDSLPQFEAKRIGFGAIVALTAPFTLLGMWHYRNRLPGSTLFVYGIIALLFYTFWFSLGPSQRIRHLLPILPLVFICLFIPAIKFAEQSKRVTIPLIAAAVFTLVIQSTGHFVFSQKNIRFVFSDGVRAAFLDQQVKFHAVVRHINDLLNESDKILIGERQLLYYLERPYFFASPHIQTAIYLWPDRLPADVMHRQLSAQKITHLLLRRNVSKSGISYSKPIDVLHASNCLSHLQSIHSPVFASRTLKRQSSDVVLDIYKLRASACLE